MSQSWWRHNPKSGVAPLHLPAHCIAFYFKGPTWKKCHVTNSSACEPFVMSKRWVQSVLPVFCLNGLSLCSKHVERPTKNQFSQQTANKGLNMLFAGEQPRIENHKIEFEEKLSLFFCRCSLFAGCLPCRWSPPGLGPDSPSVGAQSVRSPGWWWWSWWCLCSAGCPSSSSTSSTWWSSSQSPAPPPVSTSSPSSCPTPIPAPTRSSTASCRTTWSRASDGYGPGYSLVVLPSLSESGGAPQPGPTQLAAWLCWFSKCVFLEGLFFFFFF